MAHVLNDVSMYTGAVFVIELIGNKNIPTEVRRVIWCYMFSIGVDMTCQIEIDFSGRLNCVVELFLVILTHQCALGYVMDQLRDSLITSIGLRSCTPAAIVRDLLIELIIAYFYSNELSRRGLLGGGFQGRLAGG